MVKVPANSFSRELSFWQLSYCAHVRTRGGEEGRREEASLGYLRTHLKQADKQTGRVLGEKKRHVKPLRVAGGDVLHSREGLLVQVRKVNRAEPTGGTRPGRALERKVRHLEDISVVGK